MKILNFGSCNIDYVYNVDHSVQTGQTIAAKKMEIFAGGKGLNQSVAAARAGATVYHAGVIGEDGAFLKEILEQSGADVAFIQQKDCKNGHAIIQVDGQGNNCIIVYPGTNAMITKDYVDEGDKYTSSISTKTLEMPEKVGGISKGTSVSTLEGKTIS